MIRKKISEWNSCWCHADTKTRHAAQKHCATEQTTTMSAAGPGCSPVGARVISCFVCVSVYGLDMLRLDVHIQSKEGFMCVCSGFRRLL